MSGGGQPEQFRCRDEQPLVRGLAAPRDLAGGQRPVELVAVAVVQPVEQRRVLAAEVGERLEHGCVRPGALHGRRATARDPPAAPPGQRRRQVEHGGLADAGDAGEQHRAAMARVGPVQPLPEVVVHVAAADQPRGVPARASRAPARGRPGPARARSRRASSLGTVPSSRRRAWSIRSSWRSAARWSPAVGVLPGQREVGLLVGRVRAEQVLPPAGQPEQVLVQGGQRVAGRRPPTARRGRRAAGHRRTPRVPARRPAAEPDARAASPHGGGTRPRRRVTSSSASSRTWSLPQQQRRPARHRVRVARSAPPCAGEGRRRRRETPGQSASMTCSRCIRRPSARASSFTSEAAPRRLQASSGTGSPSGDDREASEQRDVDEHVGASIGIGPHGCDRLSPRPRRPSGWTHRPDGQRLEVLDLVGHGGAHPPHQAGHLA